VEDEPAPELFRPDPNAGARQIEKLRRVRKQRDNCRVQETLSALHNAAKGTENLMPHILNAVKAYASIGEICEALQAVFGEYQSHL